MRRIAICLLAASALVAGCTKHPEAQGPSASAPSAPGPMALMGRPHPKLGLWRTTISTSVGPGFSLAGELCLDASNEDRAFSGNGRGFGKDCEPMTYKAAAGGYGFTAVCRIGRRTVTTTGLASGDFKSDYSVDLTTSMDPAPSGMPAQLHSQIRAKWEGPCPPGSKPGQVSMRLSGFGQG